MSFVESLRIRACAGMIMIIDILLFKIAYKNHLLTNDIYREVRADKAAIKQED